MKQSFSKNNEAWDNVFIIPSITVFSLCFLVREKNRFFFFASQDQLPVLDTTVRNSAGFKSCLKDLFLTTFTSIFPLFPCLFSNLHMVSSDFPPYFAVLYTVWFRIIPYHDSSVFD